MIVKVDDCHHTWCQKGEMMEVRKEKPMVTGLGSLVLGLGV